MRELRRRLPQTRVIALTSFLDDERLLPAIEAGAAGYLLKDVEPSELARAVRAAKAGKAMLDPTAAARLVDAVAQGATPASANRERLTRREQEVLELLASGRSNKRIALRARHLGEDGEGACGAGARQAGRERPHRGGRARGQRRPRRHSVLGPIASGKRDRAVLTLAACHLQLSLGPPVDSGWPSRGPSPARASRS